MTSYTPQVVYTHAWTNPLLDRFNKAVTQPAKNPESSSFAFSSPGTLSQPKEMRILTFTSLVLVLVTEADHFPCDEYSPVKGLIPSGGSPKINLVHIFCGEIVDGKASGFHSRPRGIDPVCARLDYYGAIVFVWDANRRLWVKKEGVNTFWPNDITEADIVGAIQDMYEICRPKPQSKICITNHPFYSFDVVMVLENGLVQSAFPAINRHYCRSLELCDYLWTFYQRHYGGH